MSFTPPCPPKNPLPMAGPPKDTTVRAWCGKCRRIWIWTKPHDRASRHECPVHKVRLKGVGPAKCAEWRAEGWRTTLGEPPKAERFSDVECNAARRAFYFKLRKSEQGKRSKRSRGQGPAGRKGR